MKSWKQWPYWLRGGVIGGGVALILGLLSSFCIYITTPPFASENLGLQCVPFSVPFFIFWFVSLDFVLDTSYSLLFLTVLIWFALGAVFGAVFNYLKNFSRK
jgi:hypothetical protein